MASAELLTDSSRATDANGNPLSGATWTFYVSGTTTLQSVYTTADLSTPHANPVVADAGGKFAPIYFDASKSYRGVLRDANGTTLSGGDIDPINSSIWADTIDALAAPDGADKVGYEAPGASAAQDLTLQDILRQLQVSVLAYRLPGETDVGVWVNRAVAAAVAGSTILFPAELAGVIGLTWATAASDSGKALHFTGATKGGPSINVSGAITALSLSAGGSGFECLQLIGTRTAGQKGVVVTGSFCTVARARLTDFDKAIHQPPGAGFHNLYSDITFRNNVTCHVHLEDGVGPVLFNLRGDTDGPWYSGSYAEPTKGGLWLQTEGVQFDSLDFIHGGCTMETSSARNIEWIMGANSFFDSHYEGVGLRIVNNQAGKYIRGVFFDQVWVATCRKGLSIEGTQAIDGVYLNGCPIHNNIYEGVEIANLLASNIFFDGSPVLGNNRAAPVGASAKDHNNHANVGIYTPGKVRWNGGQVGLALQWASQAYDHIYIDAAATDVVFTGTDVSTGGFTNKQIQNNGGAIFHLCPGVQAPVRTGVFTVATLPTGREGDRAFVTDATATTFASVVAGGGSAHVPVYKDNANWRIG